MNEVKKGQNWKFHLDLDSGMKEYTTIVTSVKNGMVHHYHIDDGVKYWGKCTIEFFINSHAPYEKT